MPAQYTILFIFLTYVAIVVPRLVSGDDAFKTLQLDFVSRLAAAPNKEIFETELLKTLKNIKSMHTWNWHVLGTDSTLKNEYDGPHPNDSVAVIGCGLSGLTAAKHLLLQGRKVVLIEKSGFCGGNSSKASSGINGGWTERQKKIGITDSADLLYFDTLKSASRPEGSYTSKLIRKMADESKRAVEWIAKHANVSMPDVGQLGGHSVPRTHRPRTGLSGAAFISGLEKSIRYVFFIFFPFFFS